MNKKVSAFLLISIVFGFSPSAAMAMEKEVIGHPEISPINTKFAKFDGLSLDEVQKNHFTLKEIIDECYIKAASHFNPGRIWDQRNNFEFKKAVNLCALGTQWIIQTTEGQYMSEFDVLKDCMGKTLISSNTSSFQWTPSITSEKDFHMLAWPTLQDCKTFNTFDDMKKSILYFIEDSLDLIQKIDSKNLKFTYLKQDEINLLANFGAFMSIEFLFYNNSQGRFTNYYREKNKTLSLKNFLASCRLSLQENKKKNLTLTIPEYIFEQKGDSFFERPTSELSMCSYLLNINNNEYKKFDIKNNPITDIKNIYPPDVGNKIKISHSEPLLSWWVHKALHMTKNAIIEKFNLDSNNEKIKNIFPVIFYYSERQTCPSCENIIQKSAYTTYVPLIAFHETYCPDFILQSGKKILLQKNEFIPPYSAIDQNYTFPYAILEKLLNFKEPIDLNLEQFQSNSDLVSNNLLNIIMEKNTSMEKNIENKKTKINHLEEIQKKYSLALKKMPQEDVQKKETDEESPYNIISLNNKLLLKCIEEEKKELEKEEKILMQSMEEFAIIQENILYEQVILNDFKKSFQRLPIQYKMGSPI